MNASTWKDWVAPLVGVLLLAFFIWFVQYMLRFMLGHSDNAWARGLHLLSSVEAVAFAAAGFFFGREVHRERAEKSEAREDNARKEADAAKAYAAKANAKAIELNARGRALATALETHAISASGERAPEAAPGGAGALQDLARLGREYFPPAASGAGEGLLPGN